MAIAGTAPIGSRISTTRAWSFSAPRDAERKPILKNRVLPEIEAIDARRAGVA